jgi:hypothetical protein
MTGRVGKFESFDATGYDFSGSGGLNSVARLPSAVTSFCPDFP